MRRLTGPIRVSIARLRGAMANEGILRLELSWMLGVAADAGLLVVLLVVVYQRNGVVATGLLGAIRMVPAIAAGMLSGAALGRFRGQRLLLALGLTRVASAALASIVIATGGPVALLFVLAGVTAAAGAPVRPTQATLIPALARSADELVAANMAWSTAEGLGALTGPFVAGVLLAAGLPAGAAALATVGFGGSAIAIARLRFEHPEDARGGGHEAGGGLRLRDGIRALGRRPVPRWSMLAVYGQVLTRGLLNSFLVVASVELLGMGAGGVGLLTGALGVGGLFGAIFALSLSRTDRLVRAECTTLAYWGAPIALIAVLPSPSVALAAMVVVGIANASFDVAIFTIFQRGSSNAERAAVFSVFEGVAGLGAVSGSLLAPVLIEAFGARGALAVGGAILPILALVIYARLGRIQDIAVVDESTVGLLRRVPTFAQLPMTALERLAAGLVPATFDAGSIVMRQGDPGDRFVVVADGTVEVLVDGRPIHRLGPGSGVGEIALVRRSPRTATVVSITDVAAYGIDAATFLAAISGPAAAAVTERMAEAHLARAGALA